MTNRLLGRFALLSAVLLTGCIVTERAAIEIQRGRCEAKGDGWTYVTSASRASDVNIKPHLWRCVRIDSTATLSPLEGWYSEDKK